MAHSAVIAGEPKLLAVTSFAFSLYSPRLNSSTEQLITSTLSSKPNSKTALFKKVHLFSLRSVNNQKQAVKADKTKPGRPPPEPKSIAKSSFLKLLTKEEFSFENKKPLL